MNATLGEWFYPDRQQILPVVIPPVVFNFDLRQGPNAPEVFDQAVAEILRRANSLLPATR